MLGFYQSCLTTFELMEDGREYLIEEDSWTAAVAQYQKIYSSTFNPSRTSYPLKKSGAILMVGGKSVWDFSIAPPDTLVFAFGSAFPFPFALTFAFSFGRLEGLPQTTPESAENLQHIWAAIRPTATGSGSPNRDHGV